MGTKPYTRFTIFANDADRELFKVRDRGHEGLLLIEKTGDQSEFGDWHSDTTEDHISIHPTPSAGWMTIKRTIGFSKHGTHDHRVNVLPSPDGLLWPILLRACQSLDAERYISAARSKDRSITIDSYNSNSAVLVYAIVAADKNIDLSDQPSGLPFQSTVEPFTEYNLWVLHSFMNLPSLPIGNSTAFASASPRRNGVPILALEPSPIVGPTLHEFPTVMKSMMTSLSASYYVRARNYFERSNPLSEAQYKQLEIAAQLYSQFPLEQLERVRKLARGIPSVFPIDHQAHGHIDDRGGRY